jgi:trimethylamine---corrinoid protein Co-methyltransferase
VFRNDMPRYDILSEDAMDVLERGWRRLLSDIGVEFLHDGALELFRAAGQRVEGSVVRFDPEWVLECVASTPSEFDLVARNPGRTVHMGGRHMVFSPTQGPPFVREGEERREATMADFENLCRLSQTYDQLDTPGGLCCEPGDRPLDSRHLDMLLAVQTLTDKPYMGAVITEAAAVDTMRMTDMLFGGPDDGEVRVFGVVNANSPMRYDTRR